MVALAKAPLFQEFDMTDAAPQAFLDRALADGHAEITNAVNREQNSW